MKINIKCLIDVNMPRFKPCFIKADVGTTPGQLLKPRLLGTPPDMSPFFLRQYIKGHASDVFADYPQLLMEIVLRLPYQVWEVWLIN